MTPLLVLLAAAAGDGTTDKATEFCADRPGLATGTCVVPGGHVQLEFALGVWSRTANEGTVERDRSLLPAQLRIGLDQRTEVSFGMGPFQRSVVRSSGVTERVRGASDLTVTVKRRLTPSGSAVVVAALPYVTLPTGSRAFTGDRVGAGLLLPVDAPLGGPWSLTLTPEVDRLPDSTGTGRHWRGVLAWEVGFAATDRLNLGLDILLARSRDAGQRQREGQVGLAVTYQAASNLQFDTEVDAGFASASPDRTLQAGVAVRF